MKPDMFQIIQDFLITKIDPTYIIIFGSYAKDSIHKESDIDIAFHSQKNFTPYELFELAQELASLLKVDVDLIDINTASTVFKAQIYSTGQLIYCVDENVFKNLQMTALSMYAKLNEERKKILKKIDESGSIYEK
ncbi:type VII toxin-antitoxin system MntA family adenylyltransferase antitoxin [Fictibacillus terranigra]|uniref:Nucleotidyltransferase domain-containing protein n=1 Tax=Fictibacillus terranigra TaxID=3058424 RepID=A0ABT8EBT7_9BACL|nr:nucleotidyltransferase domain-containing protein [Fictibacillus sp. CENA-BCM004]MDN4075307.1 nucleotidyltransferase domain-containing protein [Fictibacillus sp. CENA-BCM004]